MTTIPYNLQDAMQPPFCPGVGYSPPCRFAGSCGRDYKRNIGTQDYSRKIPPLFLPLPRIARRTFLDDLQALRAR